MSKINKMIYFYLLSLCMAFAFSSGVHAQTSQDQRPCRGKNQTINNASPTEVKNQTMRYFSQSTCRLECTVKAAPRDEVGYKDIVVDSTLQVGTEITEKVVKEIQEKLEYRCIKSLHGTVVYDSFNFCKNT